MAFNHIGFAITLKVQIQFTARVSKFYQDVQNACQCVFATH